MKWNQVNLLILIGVFAVIAGTSAQGIPPIIPARGADEKLCKDNAGDRVLESAKKTNPINCKVTCYYTNGDSETLNSADNQPCCEFGPGPTGVCKGGRCPPGFLQANPPSIFG